MAKNIMIIEVISGISADGFNIIIKNEDETKHNEKFNYGYNASHNKGWATDKAPYVTDIVTSLMTDYDIDRNEIQVTSGKNVFANRMMIDKNVQSFTNRYLNNILNIGDKDVSDKQDAFMDLGEALSELGDDKLQL